MKWNVLKIIYINHNLQFEAMLLLTQLQANIHIPYIKISSINF